MKKKNYALAAWKIDTNDISFKNAYRAKIGLLVKKPMQSI
jgi:hypothetical protein